MSKVRYCQLILYACLPASSHPMIFRLAYPQLLGSMEQDWHYVIGA